MIAFFIVDMLHQASWHRQAEHGVQRAVILPGSATTVALPPGLQYPPAFYRFARTVHNAWRDGGLCSCPEKYPVVQRVITGTILPAAA